MAMKANASSQGAGEIKRFIGVGSFRVLGVNPTKSELEKFYGREVQSDPEYLKDKQDAEGKAYKQLRVSYMIQADLKYEDDKPIKENAALKEPYKTTVNFFIDSRYNFNKDKSKVQVIDKYGRTAWVTIEQAKNHQIPVYSNGPAKLDKEYRPAYRGEDELLSFITNWLNITPIDSYNKNTGEWMTNAHPEDCEAGLYKIPNYFKGDISELKEHCAMMPYNRVKLCVGVRTDNEGKQYSTVYTRETLRNGSNSYTRIKDSIQGNAQYLSDTVFTDDPAGIITNIHEYKENVKESDLSKPAAAEDPFAAAAALPEDDLPFGEPTNNNDDPFADVA